MVPLTIDLAATALIYAEQKIESLCMALPFDLIIIFFEDLYKPS